MLPSLLMLILFHTCVVATSLEVWLPENTHSNGKHLNTEMTSILWPDDMPQRDGTAKVATGGPHAVILDCGNHAIAKLEQRWLCG